ncbi:hypothetical protein COCMIDRAFT_38227 [Bipolaris oryzae ATCC 44560]|uniref:Uncharacterized protein n=1 Tax=Bipolaris oryzae ATCC 44560 TaxID=930090 RepID=W6Z2D4_COCMI|nr:uncharacterized protein COCMIDRAFT_38227 [Bipolaris oryzae ATCC 44560]EUC43873.1 hypothetical protein COCMIDRAFT_38227 [Bipolaris oryzae ATCC 44560]
MSPRTTKISLRRELSPNIVSNQENQLVRRSARLEKRATWQKYASCTQSNSLPSRAESHINTITAPSNTKPLVRTNNPGRSHPPAFPFIIDSDTDSTSSSKYPNSDAEVPMQYYEYILMPLPQSPSLIRTTVHSRSTSPESTCAASKESYELDCFIVSDNHSNNADEIDHGYDADESAADEVQRKNSICSTSSEDTLFVPEVKIKKKKKVPYAHLPARNKQTGTLSSEEVAEQISDAILLFSRRCNRGRKAMRVRVTEEDMRDGEVREGLKRAGKLGLVVKKEVKMGCAVWYFGTKKTL